jgi:hypothetical protein
MPSSSSSGGGAYEPIDDISPGWKYVGFLRLGNNSLSGNVWEYCVGADTQTNCTTGDFVWDPDITDGIDSDWKTIKLEVAPSGSGSTGKLTLGGVPIENSQGGYTRITRVQIQAKVDGIIGQVSTQNVSVDFTRADDSGETAAVPNSSAPIGDNTTGSGTASGAIQINPSGQNFVKASIFAQVRLVGHVTTLPPPNSLTLGIYVFVA